MNAVATKPIDRAALALTVNDVLGEAVNVPATASAAALVPEPEPEPDPEAEAANLAAVDDFLKQIGADSD
ncbi:MAG: hypothetical protein VW405_02250 [Rhodospirillaceae bacterium]